MITEACLQVPQTNNQAVNEVMIGYKGRTAGNLRQYMKAKPKKWGYKLFCRSSKVGFIHDMLMYQARQLLKTFT